MNRVENIKNVTSVPFMQYRYLINANIGIDPKCAEKTQNKMEE